MFLSFISAQIILMVRSDPVEQIRNALEQVSAARGLTQVQLNPQLQ